MVAETESKVQNLAVGRSAEQFTLYCNGQISADFPDPYTFVPLAHFWMCQHPAPRRVLVLGGGAEGLLAEILRHPVERVDYVEPDPRQIDIIEPYLAESDRRALLDSRITVHHVDARHFVKTVSDRFDLVIARLPEPTSALRARFYTKEFFGELRRSMTPRSVLSMTVAAAPGELSATSGEYVASVRATLSLHFPHVTVGWGDPAQLLAATDTGLVTTDPSELVNRYRERRVGSELFDPVWFEGATDWLDPDKVRRRAEQLDAVPKFEVSTDLRPVVILQRLVLWDRMMGGRSAGVIEWLRSIEPSRLAAGLAMAVILIMITYRLRTGSSAGWAQGAVVNSIATTGFATMALSIIWLFAFQNLYGYVYQRIGWIIAVFMGGLVVGSVAVSARSKRLAKVVPSRRPSHLRLRLIAVDTSLAGLSLAAAFLLPMLGAMQVSPAAFLFIEWVVLAMVTLTGVLGGAAFALAGGLQIAAFGRADKAAGSIVGADHAGASAGALITGILMVPVLGTEVTAFFLVGMKLVSAALLAVTGLWRPSRAQ